MTSCASNPMPATARPEAEFPPDFDEATWATVRAVQGYTMTGPEKLYSLCHAVRHVVAHDVPGAIVECGVWRGGSMMAAARTLLELDAADRDLYLFDTYEGMPEPTEHDVDFEGVSVLERWNAQRHNRFVPREARASLPEVRKAMGTVGYDESRIHFVKGMVEDTIPTQAPEQIALLRLDTDYYEVDAPRDVRAVPATVSQRRADHRRLRPLQGFREGRSRVPGGHGRADPAPSHRLLRAGRRQAVGFDLVRSLAS